MPAWWKSLESVEQVSLTVKWIAAALGLIAACLGIAALVTAQRAQTLRKDMRRLNDAQRARVVVRLRELSGEAALYAPGRVAIIYVQGNSKSEQFARELADAFTDAGWTLWGRYGTGAQLPAFSNLWFVATTPEDLGLAQKVATILREEANIPSVIGGHTPSGMPFEASVRPGRFGLLVGLEP